MSKISISKTDDIKIELLEDVNNINIDVSDNTKDLEVEISKDIGSVTQNYNLLTNKPQINEIELIGNKTIDDLGLQPKGNYASSRITNIEIDNLFK